jgi:trigger factor
MLKQKKALPKSRVMLTIAASAEAFRHAFDKELESVSVEVKIEGFRPGKAPKAKVIEKVGRPRLEAGALDQVISQAYFEGIKEASVVPVESPAVSVKEYKAPSEETANHEEVDSFTAEVYVIPEDKIDGYRKIRVKKPTKTEVTDADLKRVIEYLQKQQAQIKEGPDKMVIKEGMWVDLAYEGWLGGVKRADMASGNHPLIIGEGQFIPGFEEQLIGLKKGENKTFTLTFPKDYHTKELRGKKAQFSATINEVKAVELPVADDSLAAKFGHKTFAQLEKAIRQSLDQEKDEQSKRETEDAVLEQLLKIAKFELPAALVEQELDRMLKEAKDKLEKVKIHWEAYLKETAKSESDVREEMRPQAEKNVKIGLSLGKVIQEEGMADSENAGRLALEKLLEYATH